MSANQIISLVLLIGRGATLFFAIKVLQIQLRVMRAPASHNLRLSQKTLLALGIVVMVGQIVPITIDLFGIFNRGSFSLLLAYVFSNNITSIISAYILWRIYQLSIKK